MNKIANTTKIKSRFSTSRFDGYPVNLHSALIGDLMLLENAFLPSGLLTEDSIQSAQRLNIVAMIKRVLLTDQKGIHVNNKEIIRQLYESFASGDVPAVVAAFDNNISWIEADGFPLAGTYIGPQAVVENVFMRLGDFSDNWGVVVDRLIADGDTVVADGKYTWNHKETGAACEARMAHVWTLADGKATNFLQHVDTVAVREQIK